MVHSTTRNAPYIHPRHDSILELWRTVPNGIEVDEDRNQNLEFQSQLVNEYVDKNLFKTLAPLDRCIEVGED